MDSGCGFHRVVLPLGFMNDIEGYVTNFPQPEIMEQPWDIMLYNRFSPFDVNMVEFKERTNTKVIVDLDDDWVLPPSHINYYHYLTYRERLENNIRNADLITCTNRLIADKVAKLNPNVEIIPNGIPFGHHQFTQDREQSEKVRIFWCGSITHEKDLAILRGPIRRLQSDKDKIEMVLGGYNDGNQRSKEIWDRMLNTFTAGKTIPHKILPGTLPNEFMNMYKHADICVIPLEGGPWHAAKSNLKILEAASKKIPVVVSAVKPYINDKDAPVLWVRNQQEWYRHLKTLIHDKEKREDLGNKLYEWAVKKYNLLDINQRRRSIYESLIQAQTYLGLVRPDRGDCELPCGDQKGSC